MWSRASINNGVLWVVCGLLYGCSSAPTLPSRPAPESTASPTSTPAAGRAPDSAAPEEPVATTRPAGQQAVAPVEISVRAKADFDRAVGLMRAGNNTEAELEFKQMMLQYPQLAAPCVNLGILYRKAGRLDEAESVLKVAVEHNAGSAVAWNELGATERLRGKFQDAIASYERAIAADRNFAPAYRNLGVVSDLYLGEPERALTAFERYKELTGEDKPVSGWIAELRQRTGKGPAKPPAAPAPAPSETAPGENSQAPAAATDPPAKAGG